MVPVENEKTDQRVFQPAPPKTKVAVENRIRIAHPEAISERQLPRHNP